nr:hypothetical protein [Veillonella denticariosi]
MHDVFHHKTQLKKIVPKEPDNGRHSFIIYKRQYSGIKLINIRLHAIALHYELPEERTPALPKPDF